MNKIKIQYYKNSCIYGEFIKKNNWFIYLDSCNDIGSFGTYDILSCNPYIKMTSNGNFINIENNGVKSSFYDNPFDVIKKYYKQNNSNSEFPFSSGMIGYFGYDALKTSKSENQDFPDIAVGFYDWAIVVDHNKKETYVVYKKINTFIDKIVDYFSVRNTFADKKTKYKFFNFHQNTSKSNYIKDVLLIKKYISDGDCYQVNYSQNFSAKYDGDPWDIYKDIRKLNPAPYSSFFSFDNKYIISSSPERFISINNNCVQTKPIKGTLKRLPDPKEDFSQIDILKNDEKNLAENLMIVDLLRNDLGMNCKNGSIKVDKLFEIETFANVHHLVSTISGEVDNDSNIYNLIKDAFPGGSITGAPKLRSMEIIEELEPNNRSIYCGSIGYIGFDEKTDLNISIRTMLAVNKNLYFWGGGGIVNDSDIRSEYNESIDKVKPLLDTFSD